LIKVLSWFLQNEIIKKINEEPENRFMDGNRYYDARPKIQFIKKLIGDLQNPSSRQMENL